MGDEKKKKSKVLIASGAIFVGILILVMGCLIVPFGMSQRRKMNIVKDMKSVYSEAEFVAVKYSSKPIDKAELEAQYLWYGDEIPENALYAFTISDSAENTANGYATKHGKVVFDNYGCKYYAEESVEYFKEIVDFEKNFPGLGYEIFPQNAINECRIVLTHDCTTFEGYKTAGTIGYYFFGSGGYPGLIVGLEDTSEETIKAINRILTDADFDMYVIYSSMKADSSDENSFQLEHSCGSYYPFDESYGNSVLK